ncbi:873_t:CDS:2 [Racocetra fulgida]|uniref:873_t:CDS:1 n=1 Tax=Racocetra fulgida TaxID=60492 RepID=A0A9N8WMS2_9GLOM|nr:873_t:CDS:2 [Racocetra fulgida]
MIREKILTRHLKLCDYVSLEIKKEYFGFTFQEPEKRNSATNINNLNCFTIDKINLKDEFWENLFENNENDLDLIDDLEEEIEELNINYDENQNSDNQYSDDLYSDDLYT